MLQLFREYLIKFDYPNIHQLTEDEVANIFDANNRLFLLTWIIKQIDYSYISEMDSKHSEILLADFIFEHGFCRSSQKDLFVKGDSKLDLCEQVGTVQLWAYLFYSVKVLLRFTYSTECFQLWMMCTKNGNSQ